MSTKTMKIVIGVLAVALVIVGSTAGAKTVPKDSASRLSNRAWQSRTPPEAPPSATTP